MSKKNKIGYVAPPEPKFIREMKAKLGFQYQDNLDTKLGGDAGDFDDREGQEQNWHIIKIYRYSSLQCSHDSYPL